MFPSQYNVTCMKPVLLKKMLANTSYLIGETWKKLNEDRTAESPFPETFIGIATNLARMAQCMYQHGDGHGIEDGETKDRVLSLLVEPIPLDNDKRFLV